MAFTVNIVVHRENLDRLDAMLALAESLEPQRIEIAHVQYYGWALKNRDRLMPTPLQVERSVQLIADAQSRLSGRIQLQSVLPDYYARYPKACVAGWGRQMILIDPAGTALPCHAAAIIPGMEFDTVRTHSLDWIWRHSFAFNCFRGDGWMKDPCSNCERKGSDFGGCRCQAFQLTGDARTPTRHAASANGMKHWLQSRKRFQSPIGDGPIASSQPPEAPSHIIPRARRVVWRCDLRYIQIEKSHAFAANTVTN
jgi:PqqA peptide cyclase